MRFVSHLLLFCGTTVCFAQPAPAPVALDQAVQEALQKNLSLLAEKYNISVAQARIITARLRPNPVLTLGGDYLDILGTGFNPQNGAGPAEANARVDFILERGGKREARTAVAELAKTVAELGVLNTSRSIILDVQSAFLDVLSAKESVALAQENLKSLNSIVSVNADRVRTGDLAEVELARSRLAALQFQNQIRQAELRLLAAKNRLQLLMGRTVFTPAFDVTGPVRRDAQVPELPTLSTTALSLRPDLLAMQRDQARSQADIRLQIAQGKVDYSVGTMYHRQQSPTGTGNSMGFFFSVPLPVFNRNQGEIERARQENEQLSARIKAMQAGIQSELQGAYDQYTASRNLLESIERDMLQQAREVRQIMEYSYRRGEASLVEFLDAQRVFNDTMQSYNDARADYARSLYLLDSVTGKAVNP